MTLIYQFPLFDSILRGNLSPFSDGNHASTDYRLRLQEQIIDPTQDEGLFTITFLKAWHPKQEYYSRLLLSETFNYCNELRAELAAETNPSIRAYYLEIILNRHLTACLQQLGELFESYQLSLNKPEADSTENSQDAYINAWCMYLLRTCVTKAYLEVQDILTDVVQYSMSEEKLYAAYFKATAPVKTYLKKRPETTKATSGNTPEKSAQIVSPQALEVPVNNTLPEYLTPNAVAGVLKVNVRTIIRKLENNSLKGTKVGRLWRIEQAELESYIQKLKEK